MEGVGGARCVMTPRLVLCCDAYAAVGVAGAVAQTAVASSVGGACYHCAAVRAAVPLQTYK